MRRKELGENPQRPERCSTGRTGAKIKATHSARSIAVHPGTSHTPGHVAEQQDRPLNA